MCISGLKGLNNYRLSNISDTDGFFFKFYRTVLERSTTHIDTVLTYCRCTMHDTGLLDYMQFFKVRIN